MEGYIVSIQNGFLKVTLVGTSQTVEKKIEGDENDHTYLADILGNTLIESFGPKVKKLPLNFLVDPNEIYVSFLTLGKDESEEKLYEQATSKLGVSGIAIENTFFSYQKIAPFVYQFIAIEKDKLEKYLAVATDLSFPVGSILPWALLLPKFVTLSGSPAIFILDAQEGKYLALSELGGVYHLGPLSETKSPEELDELIQKLSIYQRNTPITDIFTLNTPGITLGKKYKITNLEVENLHQLVIDEQKNNNYALSHLNLLNMLPLPEPVKKKSSLVYVGGVLAALLIVGAYFGITKLGKKDSSQIASTNGSETVVLSESSNSAKPPEVVEENKKDEVIPPKVELNRNYLRIRVENGTNVGGLAGRTRDQLAKLGYEIVGVGDADESDRTVSLVRFTPENALYKDLLTGDLKAITGDVEVKEDLPKDLDYDVLIVMGTNDGE